MPIPNLFAEGLARGWKTYNGSHLDADLELEADVIVVGTGAGGGTTAEILSATGLKVLLVEKGPLKTSSDFKMQGADAYPELYQKSIGRMSKDGIIIILQGRAVGGTTLTNWTSSFRTPELTLQYWAQVYGVKGHSAKDMAPWFEKMEQRLHMAPWALPPSANNDVIRLGYEKLGYHWEVIPCNVLGCWNLGYCGMGCPVSAKQSMLVTTIPTTFDKDGELLYLARANRLLLDGDKVTGLECPGMDKRCVAPNSRRIRVRARRYVLSGGGINTLATLLRSKAPDPSQRVGKYTFLHTVNFNAGLFDRVINPFYGAPQSIYSDHLQWDDGVTGRMSYKLEVPPLQPSLASVLLDGFGSDNTLRMEQLPHANMMLALLRDGFHPSSAEGSVGLRGDDTPMLDYRMTDYTWDGIRRAFHTMAEVQFATGAREVRPAHSDACSAKNLQEVRGIIDGLRLEIYRTRLGSAHVMGGCAMGEDPAVAVADSLGRHHHLRDLPIHDGSLFLTSIGTNPQLSVHGLTAQLAGALAECLTGAWTAAGWAARHGSRSGAIRPMGQRPTARTS